MGQATEGLEASGSDDGGLNLAVEVLGHGIADATAVCRQDAEQVRFQSLAQSLEWFQSRASSPGDPGPVERFGAAPRRQR